MDQRLQMAMQKLAQFPPEVQQQIMADIKASQGAPPQQGPPAPPMAPPNAYDAGMPPPPQRLPTGIPPQGAPRPQMPPQPPGGGTGKGQRQGGPPQKTGRGEQLGQGRAKGQMSSQSLAKIAELLKSRQDPSGYPNGLKPGGVSLL